MPDPELDLIRADLARLGQIFDFEQNRFGENLLDGAVTGVLHNFEAEVDPDGVPWDKLSTDYGRWKSRHYPGEPMGVMKGLMRSEIPGDRDISPDSATWTYGLSEAGEELATWFQEGDPVQNRPERRFADLTSEAIVVSDRTCDHRFEEGIRG